MKKIPLLVIVFVILFSAAALADVDTGYPCSLGRESLSDNGEVYYCDYDTGTCFQQMVSEPATNETANITAVAPAAPAETATTDEKVTALEENLLLFAEYLGTGHFKRFFN